eukprot:2461814-Rhodomonas_salina.2
MITEPGILERVVMVESGFMGSMFEMLLLGLCDAALVGKMEYMLYAQECAGCPGLKAASTLNATQPQVD